MIVFVLNDETSFGRITSSRHVTCLQNFAMRSTHRAGALTEKNSSWCPIWVQGDTVTETSSAVNRKSPDLRIVAEIIVCFIDLQEVVNCESDYKLQEVLRREVNFGRVFKSHQPLTGHGIIRGNYNFYRNSLIFEHNNKFRLCREKNQTHESDGVCVTSAATLWISHQRDSQRMDGIISE